MMDKECFIHKCTLIEIDGYKFNGGIDLDVSQEFIDFRKANPHFICDSYGEYFEKPTNLPVVKAKLRFCRVCQEAYNKANKRT